MMNSDWAFLKWNDFKAQVDSRSLSIQEIPLQGSLRLRIIDGDFKAETVIHTDGHMPTEYADYQANYEAGKNQSPKAHTIRSLAQDSITANPRRIFFEMNDQNGDVQHFDKKIVSSTGLYSLRGGSAFVVDTTWNFKDTIAFSVIDKDNVLGLGGTPANPITLSRFVPIDAGDNMGEWAMVPGQVNEMISESISSAIPNGLYMRLTYIRPQGATNWAKGLMNLIGYEI